MAKPEADAQTWYDEQIAPLLARVAQRCETRGVAMVAVVDIPVEASPRVGNAMLTINRTASLDKELDRYMMGMHRYCVEHPVYEQMVTLNLRRFWHG